MLSMRRLQMAPGFPCPCAALELLATSQATRPIHRICTSKARRSWIGHIVSPGTLSWPTPMASSHWRVHPCSVAAGHWWPPAGNVGIQPTPPHPGRRIMFLPSQLMRHLRKFLGQVVCEEPQPLSLGSPWSGTPPASSVQGRLGKPVGAAVQHPPCLQQRPSPVIAGVGNVYCGGSWRALLQHVAHLQEALTIVRVDI